MTQQIDIVSEAAVRQIATRALVLDAVRQAFIDLARGEGAVFPVALGKDPGGAWSFGVKGGHAPALPALGFKYGSYFPANRARGLPSHGSTTVLVDPETGLTKAIVNAGWLNGLRTAAADAAAVQVLARPDAEVLGVIGAGAQAQYEVRAIADVRPLRLVKVWNRDPDGARRMCEALADLGVEVTAVGREAAVAGSDIVVTATPSRAPLVMAGEVAPGTHISAMGADQPGKQELDPAVVAKARLFADLPEQSITFGELQHAVREGLVEPGSIRPIGEALASPPTRTREEITVFDSSGVALQDLYVAEAVLAAARAASLVETIDF